MSLTRGANQEDEGVQGVRGLTGKATSIFAGLSSCRRWIVSVLLFLVVTLSSSDALASIHAYPEGADRVMYRSLQTLRDRTDRAWQVVLFKRVESGQIQQLHLRLVGFPEVAILKHPQTLRITAGTEQVWEAPDTLLYASTNPNIGEYDVLPVVPQLMSNTPLRLALPLQPSSAELIIPPFVVQEWREIASKEP